METAQDNIKVLPQSLVDAMVSRLRDRSWSVRKEAMIGFAKLYRKLMSSSSSSDMELKPSLIKTYSWIPTKLLHCYYIFSAEDKLCVERCMLSCLVPVSYGSKDRMLRLMHVYARLDSHATKAFDQILLSRHQLRKRILAMASTIQSGKIPEDDDSKDRMLKSLVFPIARALPDPEKARTALHDFAKMLMTDSDMVDSLIRIVDPALPCERIQVAKTELLNSVKDKEPVKEMMKNLADASGRVLLDSECISYLVEQVSQILCDCPMGDSQEEEEDQTQIAKKSVRLLRVVAPIIPDCFASKQVFTSLVDLVNHTDTEIAKQALQIFISVGQIFDAKVTSCLQPILTKMAVSGPLQLAKHAVQCIHHVFKEPRPIFTKLCATLVDHVQYEDPNYHTILVSLSQVAKLQGEVFAPYHKTIIKDNLVKSLFLVDRDETEYEFDPDCDPEWCEDEEVSYETKAKVLAMKVLVNWLVGDSSGGEKTASPVIRMLSTIIQTNGDLQQQGHVSPVDLSRLRLGAACGLLKLASCTRYTELITVDQFLSLACVIQDPCTEVRSLFAAKLNKRLSTGQLPFSYLSIFALAGNEAVRSDRKTFHDMVVSNVERRRKAYSELTSAQDKSHLLPEYVIPHVIYLISHHTQFRRTDVETLDTFKDCLWFFLEPIMTKGDSYSFVYKLLETMKQTVDAQHPDDPEINKNIYCVCDLSLGLLAKKVVLKKLGDFPGEVVLPSKLYSRKKGKVTKCSVKYLPPDYDCTPSKQQLTLGTEVEGSTPKKSTPKKNTPTKTAPQKKTNQSSSAYKAVLPSISRLQKGSKLHGFATSTPAANPVGKKATPRKRKKRPSSSEEDISAIEEDGDVKEGPQKTKRPRKTTPRKRNVRRKVLHEPEEETKEMDKDEEVGVGESGASPSVVRRSRRKMAAQEAETNHTEPVEMDDVEQPEAELKPSPNKRKVKSAPANEANVPTDEAKSTTSGIKRRTRHRR